MKTSELIPKVDVPEGASGKWAVQRFTVSKEEARFANIASMFSGGGMGRGRDIDSGTYTKLVHGSSIIMSDVPAEMRDHYEAVRMAKGHCLVNGLGLGMVANAMLQKPEVLSVTIIEKDPDVIKLVAEHYRNKFNGEGSWKIAIIEADALTWTPPKGEKYGVVWHDIWDNICADNLETMKVLHRKYGRKTEWQGSWCRAECEYQNRRW